MSRTPITLDDVTHWTIQSGIGHVVMNVRDGYTTTACSVWGNFPDVTTERPRRICSGCRKAVADGHIVNAWDHLPERLRQA